jgi:serine/threonine protein kinase
MSQAIQNLPQPQQIFNAGLGNYILGNFIGKGAFGSVYECNNVWNNTLVAKVLFPSSSVTYNDLKVLWEKEYSNLLTLRHPSITYMHDAFEYQGNFFLIIERCVNTIEDQLNDTAFDTMSWTRETGQLAKLCSRLLNWLSEGASHGTIS